jgi:hypothetical protein
MIWTLWTRAKSLAHLELQSYSLVTILGFSEQREPQIINAAPVIPLFII